MRWSVTSERSLEQNVFLKSLSCHFQLLSGVLLDPGILPVPRNSKYDTDRSRRYSQIPVAFLRKEIWILFAPFLFLFFDEITVTIDDNHPGDKPNHVPIKTITTVLKNTL
jgi:hypothetical protein